MKVLVTGGCGFVGAGLVKGLLNEGHEVMVLDDLSRGKAERLSWHAKCHVIDQSVTDYEPVEEAVHWADLIWHLAYVQGTQVFTENPEKTITVALLGIMNILLACKQANIPKELMLVSSSEVYNIPPPGHFPTSESVPLTLPDSTNPRFAYGGGKIASEIAAMAYSDELVRLCIVRPHNVYGPDAGEEHVIPQFARRMLELKGGEPFKIQGTGQETRCFHYIDDVVDSMLTVQKKGEDRNIYHLGSGEEVNMRALAMLIGRYYDKTPVVVPSALPEGSPPRRKPDIAKIRALGVYPHFSLAQGLPPTLDWYREN